MDKCPWFIGGFAWTAFDYRGENIWPNVVSHFGAMDLCGFPKDRYYYYKSWWQDEDVLYVFPHWNWKGEEGRNDLPPENWTILNWSFGQFSDTFKTREKCHEEDEVYRGNERTPIPCLISIEIELFGYLRKFEGGRTHGSARIPIMEVCPNWPALLILAVMKFTAFSTIHPCIVNDYPDIQPKRIITTMFTNLLILRRFM